MVREAERRLLAGREAQQLHQILEDRDMVYTVLLEHKEAREDDRDVAKWVLRDFYPDMPTLVSEMFEWMRRTFRGYVWESWRRRAAELRAEGFFPTCKRTTRGRTAKERAYRSYYADKARGEMVA